MLYLLLFVAARGVASAHGLFNLQQGERLVAGSHT